MSSVQELDKKDPASVRKFHADLRSRISGADHWCRHPMMRRFLYTSGVEFMAEQAGAYWLIDVVMSYQPELAKHPMCCSHQFWRLVPTPEKGEGSAVVECIPDLGLPPVVSQWIEYTDFPFEDGKPFEELWVEAGCDEDGKRNVCLLLRAEH